MLPFEVLDQKLLGVETLGAKGTLVAGLRVNRVNVNLDFSHVREILGRMANAARLPVVLGELLV